MPGRLKLARPLAFFDIESTGVVPQRDRIVEIAVVKLYPDGRQQKYCEKDYSFHAIITQNVCDLL